MPEYTFTFKCVDADGREALLTDTVVVNTVPASGQITLQPRTIAAAADTVRGVSRTTSTTITLGSDGRLSTSDGFTSAVEWGTGIVSSDYEVRAVPVGAATFTGSPTGVWLSLGAPQSWTEEFTANCSDGLAAAQTTQLDLEIRDVATSTTQASATMTHQHTISPLPAAVRLTDATYSASGVSLTEAVAFGTVSLALLSNGLLQVFLSDNSAPTTIVEPPNEWGRGLVASDYEVKFELITGSPLADIVASPAFGTWGNLSVTRSFNTYLENAGVGEREALLMQISAAIRPVGGVVIATATYTLDLTAVRYPDGIVP